MTVSVDLDHRPPLTFYLSVGLVAGSIIALQIGIMRVFSVGSWAHFGSLVVSLAMFGFGLTSAVMCVAKGWFERHWQGAVKGALLAFGPLMVVCNLAAQQVPFNAIFLISDPMQKWRLLANFVLYFLPFLAGALYLGTVFLKAQKTFNRVYFADLVGSGLCGLSVLLAMYFFQPDDLIMAPLLLWLVGGVLWFASIGDRRGMRPSWASPCCRPACTTSRRRRSASPSSRCRTTRASPTPASSPTPSASTSAPRRSATWKSIRAPTCISRRASPTTPRSICPNMPANAYLGLYIDSERAVGRHQGPAGQRDGLFQVPVDVLPVRPEAEARTPSSSSSAAASRRRWR